MNVFSFSSDHAHCLVDFRVSLRFSINFLVSLDKQKVVWLTNPINPLMSLRFFGVGYLLILSIWFSDGRTPVWLIRNPKMLTCFFPTSNFFGLKMIPSFPQYVKYFAHWMNDCSRLELHMRVSSMHLRHAGEDQFFPFLSEKHLNTEFSFLFSPANRFPMMVLYCATYQSPEPRNPCGATL